MIDRKCLVAFLRTCFKTGNITGSPARADLECMWLADAIISYIADVYKEKANADSEVFQGEREKSAGGNEEEIRGEEGQVGLLRHRQQNRDDRRQEEENQPEKEIVAVLNQLTP